MAQGLAYAVHLIVVPAVWKREKLIFEISKPWSLLREEHLTVLELGGLDAMRIFLSYSGLTGMTEKFALSSGISAVPTAASSIRIWEGLCSFACSDTFVFKLGKSNRPRSTSIR